jgi:hypothetical protein
MKNYRGIFGAARPVFTAAALMLAIIGLSIGSVPDEIKCLTLTFSR